MGVVEVVVEVPTSVVTQGVQVWSSLCSQTASFEVVVVEKVMVEQVEVDQVEHSCDQGAGGVGVFAMNGGGIER